MTVEHTEFEQSNFELVLGIRIKSLLKVLVILAPQNGVQTAGLQLSSILNNL